MVTTYRYTLSPPPILGTVEAETEDDARARATLALLLQMSWNPEWYGIADLELAPVPDPAVGGGGDGG